jgi:predicted permease
VEVGFETRHLLVASPDLGLAGYSDARASAFYPRLADALSSLPGVRSVSWASAEPVDPGFLHGTRQVELDRAGPSASATRVEVDYNEVGPRYFETLGLRVLRGRDFGAQDDSAAPLVAVINEAMARRYWPGADPVGQRLRLVLFMAYSPPLEIVGVMPDVHTASLESLVRPEVFVPLAQYARRGQRLERSAVVLVRFGTGGSGTAAVADVVRRLDPDLTPVTAETVARRMADRLSERRLYADLVGLFGILALVLAAVGLYGMLAFEVARRTREIGVRMALGATRADVLRLVMRQGLVVAAAGVVLGLLGSVALTRVLTAVLYGVTSRDPLSFSAAAIVITAAAMLASWLPARRAMAVEPAVALRAE